MSYGIKLKEILDKCNLSKEERECFEDFMDGKLLKNKEAYPNFKMSLRDAVQKDSNLDNAQKKIHTCKQWGSILLLARDLNL